MDATPLERQSHDLDMSTSCYLAWARENHVKHKEGRLKSRPLGKEN